ncbi:MAG: hypothetical protein K2J16_06715, partial [Clostridia bacterium]|nr:hypothetical protein [Clostridia bacterium]
VYSCTDVETIEITDKFVGFVRYDSGYIFHDEACDSHFVAFDTDKPIDKLMQADVYWVEQSYVYATDDSSKQPSLGEKIPNYITLSDEDDTVHYKGGGLKGSSYEWDRIESIDDFMNSVNVSSNVYSGVFTQGNNVSHLTSEAEDYLKGMKWVLRFVDTDYEVQKVEQVINGSKYSWHRATTTLISDVTILRLQFETDGKMYNLGVVDDRTIGSDKPVNDTNFEVSESNGLKDFLDKLKEIWAWLKKNGKIILYVILGIIGLCLMIPIIKVLYIFLSIPIRAAKGVSRHRRNKNNKNYRR